MSIGLGVMAPVVENVPEGDDEEVCVVCFRRVDIYSIGECDHPVCYECSTRMRVLISRNECPICRKEMDKVIFMYKVLNYADINTRKMHLERRYNIFFENEEIMKCYDTLLEHNCTLCDNQPIFRNFNQLKDHMRKNHERFYCELCVENLKIFTRERTSYSRSQLAQHRRKGDSEDTSHRGHPLCEFCDARFMDNDELFRHLRRDHYFCHFCDADGVHQYYEDYDALRDHFRADHFLCEEGDCKEERFTAAFRSKIDIQAHINAVHSHNLSKAAARQARTVDIEFTVNHPRQEYERGGRGRGRGGRGGRGGRRDRERDHDFEEIPPELLQNTSPPAAQVDINCAQDFPSLNGLGPGPGDGSGGSNKSMANKIAQQNRLTIRTGTNKYSRKLNEEDFPSLSSNSVTVSNAGAVVPGASAPTTSLHFKVNNTKGDGNQKNSGATNFSIQYQRTGDEVSGGVQVKGESGAGGTRLGVVSQNSNITLASTTKPKSKPVEDFPALGMSGKASSNKSGGTLWGASSGPSIVPPKNTTKVESKAKPPGRGKDDFPSLGGSGKSVISSSSKPAKSFKAKDFPSLAAVPPDQQQHMHNYHGKSTVTIPVSNSWTHSVDHVPKPSGDSVASKGKKKKKGGNRPGSADSNGSANNNNNKNINNNSKQTSKKKPVGLTLSNIFDNNEENDGGPQEDLTAGRIGEYESFGPAVANSNMKFITSDMIDNRKKSELKIGTLKPTGPAPTLDNEEAFPTLGGMGTSPLKTTWAAPTKTNNKKANNKKSGGGGGAAPPPGFSSKPRVPPGFTATDMTFTSSSGEKFAISPTSETAETDTLSSQTFTAYSFQLPPEFEQRNKKLIKSIQEECGGDSDKFTSFKRLAGELRSGYLGGKDYYRQCRQVMGKQTFHKILPELLVLLPDIRKQQEVLEGYRSLDGGRGCTTLFAVCTTCRQVLNSDDFGEHMSLHDQPSAEFPSLASASSHLARK